MCVPVPVPPPRQLRAVRPLHGPEPPVQRRVAITPYTGPCAVPATGARQPLHPGLHALHRVRQPLDDGVLRHVVLVAGVERRVDLLVQSPVLSEVALTAEPA